MEVAVDAVIVGGGPAGAAAALTLRRYTDCSVLVVERSGYDGYRVGETVPPGIRDILAYLGAEQVLEGHRSAPATAAAWGSPDVVTRDFLFSGRGSGWHLDRSRFDASLAAVTAKTGATIRTGWSVGTVDDVGGGWQVELCRGSQRDTVTASMLVDASGRKATVARRLGQQRLAVDALLGVTQVVSGEQADPTTLIESTRHGWWYSAPIPGDRIVVALMTDSATVRAHGLTTDILGFGGLDADGPTAQRLHDTIPVGDVVVRSAASFVLDQPGGPGWVAVGDAAAAFDPLASMGIGYALTSGAAGARALHAAVYGNDGTEMARYVTSVRNQFTAYLDLRQAHYAVETRWPDVEFWRRRHAPATLTNRQEMVPALK